MSLENCRKCKKLFDRVNSPICPSCWKEEEETFEKIRHYIKENPHSKLQEVSEETGVSEKKIMGYIREGKIEWTKGLSESSLNCKKCGKPIKVGTLCNSCMVSFAKASNIPLETAEKTENHVKQGMHNKNFRDRI